jgi:hypothetical protein
VVPEPGKPVVRSQDRFLEIAVQNAARRLSEVQPPPSSVAVPVVPPTGRRTRKRQTS